MEGLFACIRGSREALRKGGFVIALSVFLLFFVFAFVFNRLLLRQTLEIFGQNAASLASISATEHLLSHENRVLVPNDASKPNWTIFFSDLEPIWVTDFNFISPEGSLVYSTYRDSSVGEHVMDIGSDGLFDSPVAVRSAPRDAAVQSSFKHLYTVTFPLISDNTFLGVVELYCDITPLMSRLSYFENLI